MRRYFSTVVPKKTVYDITALLNKLFNDNKY